MKMLIDQEMSKEKDPKHNPPNVVAKLMGLDTLPKGEPNLSVVRSHREGYSHHIPFKHWQMEDRFMDKETLHEVHHHHHPSSEQIAHKDGHEMWLQSQNMREKLPERRRWSEDVVDEEKMALIRQKFMEAKHLSTDERLRRSKQFGEALEVLSSNSDLLVRFLDSQNLYELPFTTTPDETTKRVTLIKPLKMFDNEKSAGKGKKKKNDRLIKKPTNAGYSPENQKVDEVSVQSTRIVVLKPSPGRTHDLKALVSPTIPSPQSFYQQTGDDDVLESIKVAKEITRQMHEGLRSYHHKDKTLHSSVFSNGYSSDESSFNKSYHEYAAEKFSDLEAVSPLTRHSWDCFNGCGSPHSTRSLGRGSCSPESSVCIEAKKRLSERWTMITSNDKGYQEQRRVRRSSTLGEMLSLTLAKKSVTSEVESTSKSREPSKSFSCSHSFNEEKMSIVDSPKNDPGSKSFPATSTVYETGLSVEICDHDAGKAHHGSKVLAKSKSERSSASFKGKVASFLFLRNRKSNKKKLSKDEPQSTVTETSVLPVNDVSQSFNAGGFEGCSLAALCESSVTNSIDSVSNGQQQDMITIEPGLNVSKPVVPEISSGKQDQPSPISVLETPFEDYNTTHESLDCMNGSHMGSMVSLKSNLIDKSPPIESIARTLSWGDSCAEVASNPYPLDTNVEEQEWLMLVQKLLSAAGLYDQEEYDESFFHTRFHSLESPLDPSLRDTYAANVMNIDNKDLPINEAKRRKIRSNQKLVFDCVNAALLEVVGYGSENYYFNKSRSGTHNRSLLVQMGGASAKSSSPPFLVDHIVAQMKELIAASGMRCVLKEDCGDNHSLVVENVVRKELLEIGWVELMRLEIDVLGREIEGMLIEELVENAVVDFTGRA